MKGGRYVSLRIESAVLPGDIPLSSMDPIEHLKVQGTTVVRANILEHMTPGMTEDQFISVFTNVGKRMWDGLQRTDDVKANQDEVD